MHWPAFEQLNFQYLKQLYEKHSEALDQFGDECQFLHFKSNFRSLRDFFAMPMAQAMSGHPAWYVGFSNCQAPILQQLRQLYPRPHFLPDDAEIPNTDYVFLGYNQGAVMHVRSQLYIYESIACNIETISIAGLYSAIDVASPIARQQIMDTQSSTRM